MVMHSWPCVPICLLMLLTGLTYSSNIVESEMKDLALAMTLALNRC